MSRNIYRREIKSAGKSSLVKLNSDAVARELWPARTRLLRLGLFCSPGTCLGQISPRKSLHQLALS